MEDISSFVEIILTSFFTNPLVGVGQGLSDAIISSFKIFVQSKRM